MRHTEDPIAFTFGSPDAKALLYLLEKAGPSPYEDVRKSLGMAPETFKRVTRRLAQFDLIRLKAPKGAQWEGRRIRVVASLSPRAARILPVLRDLDSVVQQHHADVPESAERLLVA